MIYLFISHTNENAHFHFWKIQNFDILIVSWLITNKGFVSTRFNCDSVILNLFAKSICGHFFYVLEYVKIFKFNCFLFSINYQFIIKVCFL